LKSQYKAENQNWSIDEDYRGIKYFANTLGLLEFDGYEWNLHQLPNKMIIRSVKVGYDGKIFVGSYEEFGYFKTDNKGSYNYTSISKMLGKYDFANNEIWKIETLRNKVYFQSFSEVYLYQKDSVKVLTPPSLLLFMYKLNDSLYCQSVGRELYRIDGEKFVKVQGSQVFYDKKVVAISSIGSKMLVGTENSGIFIQNGSGFELWNVEVSKEIRKLKLNNIVKITADLYSLGTIGDGLILFNAKGKQVSSYTTQNGLSNNTILSQLIDNEGDLWVGTDKGLSEIKLSSPLNFYTNSSYSNLGSVYDATIFQNKLFLATNQGVYYANYINSKLEEGFKLLTNSQGQVWDLFVSNDNLLIGHNEGTFVYKNGSLKKISNIGGGWKMRSYKIFDKNYIVQSNYTGVAVFDSKNLTKGAWKVEGLSEPCNDFQFDFQGNLWLSHYNKGIYRARFNKSFNKVETIEYFDKSKGLPQDFNVGVSKVDGRVVFTTDKGLFTYDDINDSIVKYDKNKLQSEKISKIIQTQSKTFIFSDNGISEVETQNGQITKYKNSLFSGVKYNLVHQYSNVVAINQYDYLICLDNGFVIYNAKQSVHKQKNCELYLKSIVIHNKSDDSHKNLDLKKKNVKIDSDFRDISFRLSTTNPDSKTLKYKYQIYGLSPMRTNIINSNMIELKRLPFGVYKLYVELLDSNNEIQSKLSYSFQILPPWYLSFYSIILYVFALMLCVILLILFIRYRVRLKHKKQIEDVEHNKMILEKEVVRLSNEKLETEIEHKSRELAGAVIGISKKNEILIKLRTEIDKIIDSMGSRFPRRYSEKLLNIIENGIDASEDLSLFEDNFNRAHQDFLKKLKEKHSQLNPNDLRFCAYLRLNIPSKKMANILNISMRGLEARRYRIRQKMNIPHEVNLIEYIMSI
jgi:ligand-binding sensor domain-containing protein